MLVPILLTLLLVALSTWIMFRKSLFSPKHRTFVITGPMGAGKTSLYHLLTDTPLPEHTVTSIEASQGSLALGEDYSAHSTFQNISVWDFPGSHKLKDLLLYPFLKSNLNEVIGLMYVVDASALDEAKLKEIAQDLLRVFKITEGKPNGVDILVFCNKSDRFTAKKKDRVKSLLEAQMKNLVRLDMRGLEKVDGENAPEEAFVGGSDFAFHTLEGNVTFAEGNLWKEDKRGDVYDWILEKVANT